MAVRGGDDGPLLKLVVMRGDEDFGQVVFNLPIDRNFTYQMPERTPVGVRVKAPFGKRQLVGAVVSMAER